MNNQYISGVVTSRVGDIPLVNSTITLKDKWNSFGVRIKINRENYAVAPGLYAIGKPTSDDDVFVTANYKLTFDILRKELEGSNAWILILNTKGINVWCAAGKGTFGTEELISRVQEHKLKEIVNHNKLIVPQLGAPGIAAHEVKEQTGFFVKYGPVRATDINAYILNNRRVTPEMRRVNFTFKDRFVLTGIEVVSFFKYMSIISLIYFILSGVDGSGFHFDRMLEIGLNSVLIIALAYLTGTFFGPLLLPWLPGRSFAVKGLFSGLLLFLVLYFTNMFQFNYMNLISWFFTITSITSFMVMNYTGTSTYTSISGVKKEMKYAVPLQIIGLVVGVGLWIINLFI